jgi:hypothetical protein
MNGKKIMKLLDRVIIVRISYFNPYPPDIGDYTFHCVAHTIEEAIQDLCVTKNIKPDFVKERAVIAKCEAITTALLDKLIQQNLDFYARRKEQAKVKYDKFIENNPEKPVNSSRVTDNHPIFSVLD